MYEVLSRDLERGIGGRNYGFSNGNRGEAGTSMCELREGVLPSPGGVITDRISEP